MTIEQIEIQIIACVVAVACALPGTFLVLRKMALISDAISHSILPGIVLGFFFTHDLNSPLLILFAAISGVLTVVLVEYIRKTGLVKEDTAIGLVFPALFSIGVIMIAQAANDVHLDVDAVLLGELAFTPYDRWITKSGADMGPSALWVMSSILTINLGLILLFFKELKLSTFDVGLAGTLGFSPLIIHYGLMSMASITTVGSFEAIGAILVVAFMIAPAAAAYLLTKDLKKMLILSSIFGVFSAITGYWLAHILDASIAGSITTMLALIFLVVFLLAPTTGYISVLMREKRQRIEVSLLTFLLHLNNHDEETERNVKHLREHINWQKVRAKTVLELAKENNLISISQNIVSLTEKGRDFTAEAIDYIVNDERTGLEEMKEKFFMFRG